MGVRRHAAVPLTDDERVPSATRDALGGAGAIRHRLRDAVLRAGGTLSAGAPLTHVAPPITTPFGTAGYVEGDGIAAIDVGAPADPPEGTAFVDGIQRYAVEGRLGLAPIVRGYVAAAVVQRLDGSLRSVAALDEEFLVASLDRLTHRQQAALEAVGLPVLDCEGTERAHPILDVRLAARVVEKRRETLERRAAQQYLTAEPQGWLVIDGSLSLLPPARSELGNVLGVIKSHETQFLEGPDLQIALTLTAGQRTSVFARELGDHGKVFSWYLRLWPWEDEDLLHGLVRLERAAVAETVRDATAVSRWIMTERTPLTAPDGRWDRLLYPIHHVETLLRAQAGGWW